MTYETRFNKGDDIWFIHSDKIMSRKIERVNIDDPEIFSGNFAVKYSVNVGDKDNFICDIIYENNAYYSKGEILKYLETHSE